MDKIKRVLVVDDEPVICDALKFFLELEGLEVHLANNGQQALEILNSENLDLVISDVRMPIMNGRDLLLKMRELKMPVPLIFITGYSDLGNLSEFLDLGASAVIKKPFTEEAIIEKIHQLDSGPVETRE